MINRAVAPTFVEPSYFEFKKVHTEILKGGIPFHSISSGTQDIIRIELIFKAGKWYENKNGISFLATKMLLEGTNKYSSNDISRTFEQNGAFYEINPGLDHITFTVYCLTKNLDPILSLISEITNYPAFPDKELEIVKKIATQNLKVNKEKNSYLASRSYRKELFGANHPYGKITDEEHINAISRDDLFTFYSQSIKSNFEVIISGKLDDSDLTKLKSFFDSYTKRHIPSPKKTFENNLSDGSYLEKESSMQTSLRIGKKVIKKSNEDYPGLLLLNEVLGGYFGSRLMQKIREEKGYTYGIHSSIISLVKESYFVIGSDIIKKYKDEALKAIYDEIEALRVKLIDDDELATVKNYYKGNFLSTVNNVFSLSDKFKSIYFHGLDYSYYKTLFEEIDETDANELRNLANKYLAEDGFVEVLVG